ncbi:hypothetical protein CDAR_393751 [Caerostris darwini]|uniref:Uncharacterized protein n=1 Tax=Caerostris darwini TaxID=1538125 RepID=A0AAV4W8T5_9ARAC|nr:hypothetical protein CDAR_393751 [Caerostris darwini]
MNMQCFRCFSVGHAHHTRPSSHTDRLIFGEERRQVQSIMLLQFILIISVISSSARTIDTNRTTSLDPVEIVNQRDPEGHRDKRQLFVFNNDIGQILNRAIDSLGIIRDGYQVGRLFTTSISNMVRS